MPHRWTHRLPAPPGHLSAAAHRPVADPIPPPAALQQTNAIATGHTSIVTSLWVEDSYLFTGALDGVVKVWDPAGQMLFEQGVTNAQNQPSGITAMLVTTDASGSDSVLVTACNDKVCAALPDGGRTVASAPDAQRRLSPRPSCTRLGRRSRCGRCLPLTSAESLRQGRAMRTRCAAWRKGQVTRFSRERWTIQLSSGSFRPEYCLHGALGIFTARRW